MPTRTVMRAVRLPVDLDTDLAALARRSGADWSTVARTFLRQRADQALATGPEVRGPALLDPPELHRNGGTARQNDRPTAKKAAADVAPRAGTQRRHLLGLFLNRGDDGLTTDEAVAICHRGFHSSEWPHNGLARRVSDLFETGAIEPVYAERGEAYRMLTRKTRTGADAQVWRITPKGRAWLNA